jgi:hypothetical protein
LTHENICTNIEYASKTKRFLKLISVPFSKSELNRVKMGRKGTEWRKE